MAQSVKFVSRINVSFSKKMGKFFIRKNTKPEGGGGRGRGRFGKSPDFFAFFCETFPYPLFEINIDP